jgi:hypothetical protein
MPIYRVIEPRLGRQRLLAWRRRALHTLALLNALLLVCVVGLVLLDPSSEPFSHKFFVAIWNAAMLLSTLGAFTDFTRDQQIFVLVLLLSAIIIGGYAVTTLTGLLSSDSVIVHRENRAMERILDRLTSHVVVVGFGAIGRAVAARMKEAGERVVIIDRDESLAAAASELGYLVVEGDAGVDSGVLERACVAQARAFVVTSEEFDRKLAITLSAHALNPQLAIAITSRNDPRAALLPRAGASEVVMVDELIAQALVDRLERNPRRVGSGAP